MADPTAAQLKVFAKTGVAMPDESYYVRNADDLQNAILAVGRAAPSSDQTEVQRRNDVRRHIMVRAKALNLSSQIPDSWNSDGSLKHSDVEEFLAHLGVAGSTWSIRDQRALERHIRVATGRGAPKDQTQVRLEMTHFDMRRYKGALRLYSADQARALQSQKERSAPGHAIDMPVEEFLQHFGRKGMKWGERVFSRGSESDSSHMSTDSVRTEALRTKVRAHGTSALTNDELQHLTKRLNLEKQYSNLSADHVTAGRKITNGIVRETSGVAANAARQTATQFASKYAAQGVEHLIKKSLAGKR